MSHALVTSNKMPEDFNERMAHINEQVQLINKEIILQNSTLSEMELLKQLKHDLIEEKLLLESRMDMYLKLETKSLILCPAPSSPSPFKRNN